MRRIERPPADEIRKRKTALAMEPMAEWIAQLNENGKRDWKSMTDSEVLDYARKAIEKGGTGFRQDLKNADSGLHEILRKRNLLGKLEFGKKQKRWGSDEEVVGIARKLIAEKGVRNPSGLQKENFGLYKVLWKRRLLGKLIFREKQRKWGSDEEVVGIARKLVEEKEIRNPRGLEKADAGLYQILVRRNLVEEVGFEKMRKVRKWGPDEEVIGIAKNLVQERRIRCPEELNEADTGLYQVLRKRNLFGQVGFERIQRVWGSDEKVLEEVRKAIEGRKIKNPKELEKSDPKMYDVLRRRKLLAKVAFKERRVMRKWGSDENVLGIAGRFIGENEIRNAWGLERADRGLYTVLLRRKLLGQAFAPIEQEEKAAALREIAKATEKYVK